MPPGKWRDRFVFALRTSLDVLKPHQQALRALTPVLVGDPEEGIFSPSTAFSRLRVQRVFEDAVAGSDRCAETAAGRSTRPAAVSRAPGRAPVVAAGQERAPARHDGAGLADAATAAVRRPDASRSAGSAIRDRGRRAGARSAVWAVLCQREGIMFLTRRPSRHRSNVSCATRRTCRFRTVRSESCRPETVAGGPRRGGRRRRPRRRRFRAGERR